MSFVESRTRSAPQGFGRPVDVRGPLEGACDETTSTPSFPYGCAVCEVEVDPGGIAQGVGEALWEHLRYVSGVLFGL